MDRHHWRVRVQRIVHVRLRGRSARLRGGVTVNHTLRHGLDADAEVASVIRCLPPPDRQATRILVGFSTGCAIALLVASELAGARTRGRVRVVLCNPASLLPRLTPALLCWMVPGARASVSLAHPHWQPLLGARPRTSTGIESTWAWARAWAWMDVLWGLACLLHFIFPARWLATVYYWIWGRLVNEPRPEELAKIVFRLHPRRLLHTVTSCLVVPDLQALIRRARSLDVDVRLVVGQKDYYQSFSTDLASVPLFRARGDHHMLHHHPHESAWSVYTSLD